MRRKRIQHLIYMTLAIIPEITADIHWRVASNIQKIIVLYRFDTQRQLKANKSYEA